MVNIQNVHKSKKSFAIMLQMFSTIETELKEKD